VSTVDQSIRIPPATSNAAAAAAVSGSQRHMHNTQHGAAWQSARFANDSHPAFYRRSGDDIGNESVPKIARNNTTSINFSKTAISTLVISNRNSLRVLFDKIASVYFI